MSAGLKQTNWYLLQVDMDQYKPVAMSNYGVHCCQCYVRQYEECNKYPTMACRFGPEIRKNNHDGMPGKMFPVIASNVNNLLQNNHTYMWYQDNISLAEHRLVGPFQFGTKGRKKLKHPIMVYDKQWKELEKEVRKKGINNSDTKKVFPLEW